MINRPWIATLATVVVAAGRGHVACQQHAPRQLRLQQMIHQPLEVATQLTGLHGLLRGTCQPLAP